MSLNPNIILAGQPVDIVGAMSRGNALAADVNAVGDQNALRSLYRTQGADIMAGKAPALNALAGIDPTAALGIQDARMGLDARQLDMQATRQRMDMLSRDEQRQVETFKAQASAAEAQAAAAQIEDAVKMGLAIPDAATWDQVMSQQSPELVGQFGNRQALAMKYMSMAEALKASQGPEQPAWRAATPQEAAGYGAQGGQINAKTGEFRPINPPRGSSLTVDPATGAVTLLQGVTGGAPGQTVGDVYKPGTTDQAIGLIDDILANPSLGRVTGPVEGGGGNNIDELPAYKRAWYGPEGLDAIDKVNQLQSQAWMAARAMLKGGGQITDYESKKAEAAVARLSRAKGEAEFKAALKDLRDAITDGEAKLRATSGQTAAPEQPAPTQPAPEQPATESMSDDELLKLYGG